MKTSLCLILLLASAVGSFAASAKTLFPTDLPRLDWVHFKAEGYSEPVCGVVYRLNNTVTNGLALGGIDTGCLDLETSGMLGYCTIFNTHVPRRGPINLPILGMSVGGQTWVLCDPKQVKDGWGEYQTNPKFAEVQPVFKDLRLTGVKTVKEIHYWGHYPVADLEFDTDAPVSVGLRSWAPFYPGDTKDSMIPAIVFEVHLRNTTDSVQKGSIAFSFPGPTSKEAGSSTFERKALTGGVTGVEITAPLASYFIGAIGTKEARIGGELGPNGPAWAAIEKSLPAAGTNQPGASVAVDFDLQPGKTSIVRFLLTWSAPTWNSIGFNGATKVYPGFQPESKTYGEARAFTHMYSKYYPSAAETAALVAKNHKELLSRVIAWQQVIYSDDKLPVWLRDSLINNLYLITETGYWAQKKYPLPSWVKEEDGLWGMNECPRGCPQIECIPCSFYGSLPLTYFFPELQLSTIRGYKGYQYSDGAPPWIFGGSTEGSPYIDFAYPMRGYQFASNGISLAGIVDRFLLCRDTPDKKLTKELYPMMKQAMIWTVNLRTTPSYSIGQKVISMPDPDSKESHMPPTEWFEASKPGWQGMTAHIGGLHLAQLRITERMAREVGDTDFANQCETWIKAGSEAMEKDLWTVGPMGGYYLNYFDPSSQAKSDWVFGYQMDGEWITDFHGLPSALPENRVKATLDTIKKCNVGVTKYGAVNYARADGKPRDPATEGTWDYGIYSYFPPEALMLAMNYMYEGQEEFGVELARKVWHNLICRQGYTWDMTNIMRGDVDTGERTFGNDYYQDMMLWSLPAALEAKTLDAPTKPGGLVYRVMEAAKK